MTALEFIASTLNPGVAWYAAIPGWTIPTDERARMMLLVIPGQESGYSARIQGGNGPAHSFYQMERAGGVTGVLTNAMTYKMAMAACAAATVPANPTQVWGLMATEKGDNLSVAFARLLLWTDHAPLPAVGDEAGALALYERVWRPGAISAGGARAAQARTRWSTIYKAAMAAFAGENA